VILSAASSGFGKSRGSGHAVSMLQRSSSRATENAYASTHVEQDLMKRKTVTKLSSLNSNESLRGLIVFLACVVLSGCAGIEARRRNPAETDKREASAAPIEAVIRLRAGESARHASFQISLESTPCKGFKDVGVALSGWAEDEVPPKDIVELIPGNALVQVRAFWFSMPAVGRKDTCGPVVRQFTPKSGTKYLVNFSLQSGRCTLDITENSATPQPVLSTSQVCSATLGEIL